MPRMWCSSTVKDSEASCLPLRSLPTGVRPACRYDSKERLKESQSGSAESGALYYLQYGGGMTGFIAERGLPAGRIVQAFSGYGAAWSGNTLAYIRGDREVVVRSLDTDSERAYWRPFLPIFSPRLLRDASAAILYIFPGSDGGHAGGSFYRVEITTGEFNRLFGKDTAEHGRSNVGVLSHDERMLHLGVLANAQPHWSGIVGVDLATGGEGPVVPLPEPGLDVAGMAISPDGATLAFHAVDGRIVTMRLDGSDYREVCGPSPGGGWRDVMRWSSDGRFIIFRQADGPDVEQLASHAGRGHWRSPRGLRRGVVDIAATRSVDEL